MTTLKFRIDENNYYNGLSSDGTIATDDTYNAENKPINCQRIDNAWVLDTAKELEILKAGKKQNVQDKWQEQLDSCFSHDGNLFDCDDGTLSIVGARLAHAEAKTNLSDAEKTFYNVDKNAIEFIDKASFETFCKELIEYRNTLDQHRVILKKQINDATDTTQLDAIDITTGW